MYLYSKITYIYEPTFVQLICMPVPLECALISSICIFLGSDFFLFVVSLLTAIKKLGGLIKQSVGRTYVNIFFHLNLQYPFMYEPMQKMTHGITQIISNLNLVSVPCELNSFKFQMPIDSSGAEVHLFSKIIVYSVNAVKMDE